MKEKEKVDCAWYHKWQDAYEKASFYKSEQNTVKYWDAVANSESSGLTGDEHIELLADFLFEKKYVDENSTVLDIGCGHGDYSLHFAKKCKQVIALDYSENMLERCKHRCEEQGVTNVSFMLEDVHSLKSDNECDVVLACLNPSTYSPEVFSRLLKMSAKIFVYFSMDTPIENINEPIYYGTNSVRYPEKYLEENGIKYTKLKYEYAINQKDGATARIPFAYLVIYA